MSSSLHQTLTHLAVTVLFPVLILQPHLVPGVNLQDRITPAGTFMLAALVPCLYVLGLQWTTRKASPVWLLFTLSTLVNALSSFWWTDGLTFAIKDSSGSLFLAFSTLVSLLVRKPLFGFVLREFLSAQGPVSEKVEAFLQEKGRTLIVLSTVLLCLKGLTVATLNTLVKHHLVTAGFGTALFNQQLSGAVAVMVPVAYLATTVTYGVLFLVWWVGLRGKLKFPFTPARWIEAMEQSGSHHLAGKPGFQGQP